MRITIIPDDKFVSVDGDGLTDLDLSFIDSNIHAIQWYDTYGEVEYKDPVTQKMTYNREITDLSEFQQAIAIWQTEKNRVAAATVAT